MSAARRIRLAAALSLGAALAAAAPDDGVVRHDAVAAQAGRVELAGADWTRDGRRAPPAADGDVIVLASEAMGTRWATVFTVEEALAARLALDWTGAPDGLLFEIVLDGTRLPPPRDAWRPGARDLVSDVGPVWLGPGRHLLEVVAREDGAGAVRLRALVLGPADGGAPR